MYRVLFILIFSGFCLAGLSQIRPGIKQRPLTTVSILHIEPEQPVEGMPVIVYFRFTNRTSTALSGWIGADINSGTGVPGKSAVDWEVKELNPGQYIDGAVFVRAPNAGINRLIRVFYYTTKTVINDQVSKSQPMFEMGQQSLNIAALLSFNLTQFKINHTRARTTDTDYGSLYVSVNDKPVMQPASKFLGNYEDGTYIFTTDGDRAAMSLQRKQAMASSINAQQQVTFTSYSVGNPKINNVFDSGPFAVVPEINSIIKPAFFIYNGGSIANSDDFLKGFAEATANPQLFNGPRPGRAGWFDAMRILCPPLNVIGACDGFVVADSMMIQTNDLFEITGTGNASITRNFDSEEFASQIGCGNTSNYQVDCQLKRLSHAGSMEVYSPIYASVTSKQKINMLSSLKNYSDIVWQQIETIADDGSFIMTPDPSYGVILGRNQYIAPDEITRPLLVILRGIQPQVVIDNDQYDIFEGSELRKVTAIIQLIPGQKMMNPNIYNNYNRTTTGQEANPPTPPAPTEQKTTPKKIVSRAKSTTVQQ